jgi:ABC-type Mn2+/Zn2+ transport system permease subunit
LTPLDWLLEPLRFEFMLRGLAAATLVGITCAVVGCYVVLRGMAFLGDAVSHAILPGVAVSYLLKGSLLLGGLAAGLVVALTIGALSRRGRVREDTAIGVVFAGALALGVGLMSTIRTYSTDLAHVLFGNVLGVSDSDIALTAALAALVIAVVMLLYKELLLVSFDPIMASSVGMPVAWVNSALLVLIAITIVVSMQAVGIGLVAAMLVTPAATANLLVKRLAPMMGIAAAIGGLSGIAGLYLSYYLSIASGPAIVLACTACFAVAYVAAGRDGAPTAPPSALPAGQ